STRLLPRACVTPTSIPRRCARPRARRCSLVATTTRSALECSPQWRPASPAMTWPWDRRLPRSVKSWVRMAIAPAGVARVKPLPCGRRARAFRSRNGRPAPPFRWTKKIPAYFCATKQGTPTSSPAKIKDKGGIRWQFHHVIDVLPTILEAAGIPQPVQVNGVTQKPIEGVSMMYTFDANAGDRDAQSRHRTQYFEMGGSQGL